MQVEPTRLYLLERRNQIILQLNGEGFNDSQIGEIMNGLDRTWVHRIVKLMKSKVSKHKSK